MLAFDFRHLGESDGEPRQLMSLSRYFEDIDAALAFIRTRPELDAARVALWGTSFGASHVVATAARRDDIAAAVVQCPILQGRAPALSAGFGHLLRFTGPIVSDLLRAALGLGRRYVQIVGRPGELAFVNVPGAYEGWMSVVPPGVTFDGRITAGAGPVDAVLRRRRAGAAGALPVAGLRQRPGEPDEARDRRSGSPDEAPRGRAIRYPTDHFQVYHPPFVERIVADQIAFLTEHLDPE